MRTQVAPRSCTAPPPGLPSAATLTPKSSGGPATIVILGFVGASSPETPTHPAMTRVERTHFANHRAGMLRAIASTKPMPSRGDHSGTTCRRWGGCAPGANDCVYARVRGRFNPVFLVRSALQMGFDAGALGLAVGDRAEWRRLVALRWMVHRHLFLRRRRR